MRIVVFSDVHGNLPALEAMLENAGRADGYICLGDVVGYGPWSNECVDLVTNLPNLVFVEGNHERDFIRGRYLGDHPVARAFFDQCHPRFDRLDEISGLETSSELGGFVFSHTIGEQYIFPDTSIELDRNYVIGHTHRQFTISQPPFQLHNPGSVGQNREYINLIDYMTIDDETMTFTACSLAYDDGVIIKEMRARNYPGSCVDYYVRKPRL